MGSCIKIKHRMLLFDGSIEHHSVTSTEVSRNWYSRNDAVTTAESNAACGDWFVPYVILKIH